MKIAMRREKNEIDIMYSPALSKGPLRYGSFLLAQLTVGIIMLLIPVFILCVVIALLPAWVRGLSWVQVLLQAVFLVLLYFGHKIWPWDNFFHNFFRLEPGGIYISEKALLTKKIFFIPKQDIQTIFWAHPKLEIPPFGKKSVQAPDFVRFLLTSGRRDHILSEAEAIRLVRFLEEGGYTVEKVDRMPT